MTKEEIINAVLNLNIVEIYDINDKVIFTTINTRYEVAVLSVSSRGIIITYDNGNMAYIYSVIPFENIKIVYSEEKR